MVAYVGLAPVFGGMAHRLPRRALLVGLDLARAALIACLPFVTEIWQIYLLIFLLNSCSAGFTPTFQATIPDAPSAALVLSVAVPSPKPRLRRVGIWYNTTDGLKAYLRTPRLRGLHALWRYCKAGSGQLYTGLFWHAKCKC
jgi:hypothetical protein